MKVSLAIESLENAEALARVAREAADAGFDALELPLLNGSPLSWDAPPATCHEFSKAIGSAGLSISALALPRDPQSHLASYDPSIRRQAYEHTLATLDRACWLGADRIVLTPGIVGGPTDRRPQGRYEETYMRAVEGLLALRFEAQQRSVHIACAITDTRFLLSPMEARAFIERVNSPFIGLSLDLGALLPIGYPQDWIASLGHRLFHVYTTDYRLGEHPMPCALGDGDGDVDWLAVGEALYAARFEGPLTCPPARDEREARQRMARVQLRTPN